MPHKFHLYLIVFVWSRKGSNKTKAFVKGLLSQNSITAQLNSLRAKSDIVFVWSRIGGNKTKAIFFLPPWGFDPLSLGAVANKVAR